MTAVIAALAASFVVGLWGASRPASRATPAPWVLVPLALFVMVLAAGPSLPPPLVVIAALTASVIVGRLRRSRMRVAAARRTGHALAACEGMAADLRSGLPPTTALDAAADDWAEFRPVADAARLGGDVPAAVRRLAAQPGAGELRTVAAAWVVAHRSGASLADAVSLASRSMREAEAMSQLVETELASARATARMLALLPLGVLVLARGTGGDPFAFLLGTAPGLICLSCGLLLTWAGLVWLDRIAEGVRG
ncbi:tight adherence protein B [Marmoricola sp. OAE513]|uniref:type II secretion system F family protein n=1 Tax=Marmoricola sp. OAE513 TaxID=2817894 RepID=UPI001AE5D3D0